MNTHIEARRRLGFGTHGAAVSVGLLALTLGALTLGAPTTARAELAHRLDVGEPTLDPPGRRQPDGRRRPWAGTPRRVSRSAGTGHVVVPAMRGSAPRAPVVG